MDLIQSLNQQAVTSAYLFANTPGYLFRRLREDQSVIALARSSTPVAIAAELASFLEESLEAPSQIATAYALLVAITHGAPPSSIKALSALDLSKLDWGMAIYQIYISSILPTYYNTVAPIVQSAPYQIRPVSHSSTGTISITLTKPQEGDMQ